MRQLSTITGAAALLFVSGPAAAADKNIGYKSPTQTEGICGEKDGTYWQTPDGSSWGCGYKGGGGIMCDQGGKDPKSGQTIPPGCLETTRTAPSSDIPWHLAGLLGLLGLLGLANRERRSPRP
jgi:hypothetical protein